MRPRSSRDPLDGVIEEPVSRIFVCGLDEMPHCVAELRPARLVSLLPSQEQPPTPRQIASSDHLRLLIEDVDEAGAGSNAPARPHIETLVSFLRSSPPGSSILIHCLAGVSRSPAAALIAMALDAPGQEREVARLLRSAAPFVDPNRLMIKVADEVLERRGRLVAALASMGAADLSRGFAMIDLPRSLGRRGPGSGHS